MKNRRLVIGAFLLVAVLCLGVGFAALQDTLSINGTLSYNPAAAEEEFNADVQFVSAEIDATSTAEYADTITAVVGDVDTDNVNDLLTITVPADAFTSAGQVAVIKATVKNDSTDTVNVSAITKQAIESFSIESGVVTIDAGATSEITITITLDSTVAVTDAPINLTLTATSAN